MSIPPSTNHASGSAFRNSLSWLLTTLLVVTPLFGQAGRANAQPTTASRTRSAANQLVTLPSPEIDFLIGPQVSSGTSTVPGAAWFDQNAIDRGLALCGQFPDEAHTPGNILIAGTVSVTNGSRTVTGVGTRFLSEAKDYAVISNGGSGRFVKIVSSVQSDTSLTLNAPWQGGTFNGQTMSSPTATEVDNYQGYLNYYDFALTQYTNYYRTGDQRFLNCARKVADSWWSQPIIDYGRNLVSVNGEGLAPRSVSLTGLILRALDGRPEMWPWITDYVDYHFRNWVEVPLNWNGLYYGVRDGGFMLLYAADLGAVHPDPGTRNLFRTRALAGATGYYARLQSSDGSYRWSVDDSSPGALDGFTGMEQPFMVGILNEGMIATHRLTNDPIVRNAILKSVEHEYQRSYSPNGWRGMYYFVHGQFNNGLSCETGCGNAANPFPPTDPGLITEARQLNATTVSQFGYAFYISGDARFRTWGNEVFDATYSGADGYRGLAAYRGKEYDESYRTGARYLAWSAGGVIPTPTPTPTPSPSPTPTPSSTPTPTPTPNPSAEVIWVDDSLPAGATPSGQGEQWNWIGSGPSPISGILANQSVPSSGMHQHYFTGATSTLNVGVGDTLVAHVFIDPANLPSQIMLQWNDGDWEQRAYWGASNISLGTENTNSRRRIGALPPAGQWVRLEVPASQVGLEGKTISGMAFTLFGGGATWDRAGKNLQAVTGPNPIGLTDFFVRQHYLDFLGREPDPAGFAGWQNLINNCAPGDITCDRVHVSGSFFQSPEFLQRGYFVYRFYSVSFGRKPDYGEFAPDFQRVSGFLTEWELEAAKVGFIDEFITRPAFVAKFGRLNNTQYVDTLLSTAGVAHTSRNFWIAALGDGTRTRAQVLREIAESTAVYNKNFNQAFVVMQYFGYLRRQPDGQYLTWIAHLDATGDFRSMISGFMNSLEYRARFGP